MGWLPARPVPCRCGHPHASRNHLISCLDLAIRLNVSPSVSPNPLDYVLNQLPSRRPPLRPSSSLSASLYRWLLWWPVVCTFLLDVDIICHPDSEFSAAAKNRQSTLFFSWLRFATSDSIVFDQQVPPISLSRSPSISLSLVEELVFGSD